VVTPLGEDRWRMLLQRATALTDRDLEALSPVLILVPHQDDETLGCGGLIATASERGLRPRVAYLTDGGGSHLGSPNWPRRRLSKVRRAEAASALSILGVDAPDTRFLGWPDGAPWAQASHAFAATLAALVEWCEAFEPRSIWASWRHEPHADHVATALLADHLADALRWRPRRFDYLVWGWGDPDVADAQGVRSLPCPDTVERRRAALACHRTQTTDLIDDAASAFLMPANLAGLTDRPAEIYLEVP
jgi:LmbE family N-acetylglucosaminyl deacetylase